MAQRHHSPLPERRRPPMGTPVRDAPFPARQVTARTVVDVSSLSKRYGDVIAVDEVTFSLTAGTITGVLGPNGAGKTTTLRLLLGLAQPTGGEALLFGRRYRELDR